MPLIVFVIIYRFKGLIQIAGGRQSAYPSVFIAVFMPCIALVAMAMDYNIYDYSFLLKPIAIFFLVAVIIAYTLCKEMTMLTKSKSFTLASLLICIGCYAYGATILLNGYNDTTTAQALSVKVNAKHKSSGRTTTYYLKLDAWGHYKDAQNVSVPSKLYDAENTGDTVTVYLKQGNLNIPWFWIEATTAKNP